MCELSRIIPPLRDVIIVLILFCSIHLKAQDRVRFTLFDGIAIAGYVDRGAFVNFTGPNVSLMSNDSKFIFGMLPSLRFKEDQGTPKNSFVMPNLGVGVTYSYKLLAVQLPLYYNAKTATGNGKWNVGIGLGMRLNFLNKNSN